MKNLITLFILIFSSTILFVQCKKEQTPVEFVNIPDQHFLGALIEDGVDNNGDGLISYDEAEMVTGIYLDPDTISMHKGKISSIEGVEAFLNLDSLHCCGNQIKELDLSGNTQLRVLVDWIYLGTNIKLVSLNVSKNTKLEVISVLRSQITNLDVSNCPSLQRLWFSSDQLTDLDLSKNFNLTYLSLFGNQLSRLDLSKNFNLKWLEISENQLSRLDISKNIKLTDISIWDMPNLTEVCVWTMPFPPAGVSIDTIECPNAYFTTECSP